MSVSPSKSSQKAKNVVITLLALWSIVSLIVIVVWATSPDLKGSAQCRSELQEATEKLEGAKVVFAKNKEALEQLLEKERQEQQRHKAQVLLLLGRLNATNATLDECRQENAVLYGNISVLQEDIEELRQTEANLTAQLRLKEEHIEELQQNVTETFHKTLTCYSLKAAAESQMVAAQSQTKGCESREEYLKKQLQKCKEAESDKAKQSQSQQQDAAPPTPKPSGATLPLSCIPALTLLVCGALHLVT
ncbi:uncharacterized protein ABDE67_003679 [Symphorus nematophorus]